MISWKEIKEKIINRYFDVIEYDEEGNEIIVKQDELNEEKKIESEK